MSDSYNDDWAEFLVKTSNYFNVTANDEFLLFIVGLQESGQGFGNYSKQDKTDLISLASCRVLEMNGFMKQTGKDCEGWPIFESIKDHHQMSPVDYKSMIRQGLMDYFKCHVSL